MQIGAGNNKDRHKLQMKRTWVAAAVVIVAVVVVGNEETSNAET